MPYDHNDTKKLPIVYVANPGCFLGPQGQAGEGHLPGQWETCRDRWHVRIGLFPWFFFSHAEHRGGHTAAFIERIERHLGLDELSYFGGAMRNDHWAPYASWVQPSSFWHRQSMRQSLFTILLRAGGAYPAETAPDNGIEIALSSNELSNTTKHAIYRFLNGFTFYTGEVINTLLGHVQTGWFNVFAQGGNYDRLEKPAEVAQRAAFFKWINAGRPEGMNDHFFLEASRETDWPEGMPNAVSQRHPIAA